MKVEEAGLRIRPWGVRSALKDLGDLHDDIVFMIRRAAYVDAVRSVALRERRLGWVVILAGLALLVWTAAEGDVHSRIAHVAEASIGLGSLIFFYVMHKRARYARAHPFDPQR